MILLGGVEQAADAASDAAGALMAWLDHAWHDLEHGDWRTYLAAFVLFAMVATIVGLKNGAFRRGGSS